MRLDNFDWTEDRTARLCELWGRGATASEIAAELGSVSRSAVIGKIFRLGKSGERAIDRRRTGKPAPKLRRSAPSKPVCRKITHPAPETFEQRKVRAEAVEPLSIAFAELTITHCRYPYGGDNGQPITFCGHDRIEGHSYCKPHFRLCWVKPQERKLGGVGAVQRP